MKKRGFTLIELLAVVAVLAIILLIATPIIMNVIKNVRLESYKRSAEGYEDAIELMISRNEVKGILVQDGLYTINNDGSITKEDKNYKLEMSGDYPIYGRVAIKNGVVVPKIDEGKTIMIHEDYIVTYNSSKKLEISSSILVSPGCEMSPVDDQDKDGEADIGDLVKCAGESFYVIPQDLENHKGASENTISLLAKHNLNIGGAKVSSVREGIQTGKTCGHVAFSTKPYWEPSDKMTFVYNSQADIYQYVENYKNYLKEGGVTSITEATIITETQRNAIMNTYSGSSWFLTGCGSWTGSTSWKDMVWVAWSKGGWSPNPATDQYNLGVRPVIIVSKSNN